MERRIAVRALVVRDGKLLCVNLKREGGVTADFWCLPGGGVDPGESLLPALHREMIEETGIAPEIGALLYVQQFRDDTREHLEFFFHVTNTEDYLNIDLASTSHGGIEIAAIDFIDPSTSVVMPKFLSSEDLVTAAAERQPAKFFSEL